MKNSNSRKPNKTVIIVACIALVMAIGTIAVFAYLSGKSGPVTNTLNADTDPSPAIVETFDGTVKKDVKVNVGKNDYTVYVRAAIVVNWVDANGNVLADAPVSNLQNEDNYDYILDLNLATGNPAANQWSFGSPDGFYYYSSPVPSEGSTEVLIKSVKVNPDATVPEGYTLSVEIVAQTIQAIGTTDTGDTPAVVDAWGVILQNGLISKRQ